MSRIGEKLPLNFETSQKAGKCPGKESLIKYKLIFVISLFDRVQILERGRVPAVQVFRLSNHCEL